MLIGFRAGNDPDINISSDDFIGTRRALALPEGTAQIGRVFPNGASFGATVTPLQVVAKAEAACGPVLAAGMWPYFSLKPNVNAAITGELDQHFFTLARWIAGLGVPFYLSLWHEPENDAMGAGSAKDHINHLGRATNFVAVHTRAYELMKDVAGDNLRMGPCHMVYQWQPGSDSTSDGAVAQAWRVPDNRADFYGADSYTSNWSWTSSGRRLRTKPDFQRWLSLLNPDRSKIVLAERGISRTYSKVDDPPVAQATILAQDYQYLTELGAHALVYWNSGGANDDSVYLLGAPARDVFRQIAVGAGVPTPPTDRYQAGYNDGVRSGLAQGQISGRDGAFREVSEWATSRIGA